MLNHCSQRNPVPSRLTLRLHEIPMASSVKSRNVLTGPPSNSERAKRAVLATLATLGEFPTPHHARVTTAGQAWRMLATVVDAVALLSLCTLGPGGVRWSTSVAWFTDFHTPRVFAGEGDRTLFHVVYVWHCGRTSFRPAPYPAQRMPALQLRTCVRDNFRALCGVHDPASLGIP